MNLCEQIKVICFDYDGTLVDFKGNMSSFTKECLIKLKDKGYKLALVSGRPVKMARNVISSHIDPDIFDYYFGNNGSEYFNLDTNKSELSIYFTSLDIRRLYKLLHNDLFMFVTYLDDYFLYDSIYNGCDLDFELFKRKMKPLQVNYDNYDLDTPKVVLFSSPNKMKEVDEYLSKIKDNSIEMSRSADDLVEIIPKGCGKHLAIFKLMNILNISKDEIMAVGDNDNDISMLDECISVGMDNAKESVKRHCLYIAGNIEDKGIYAFFKKYNFMSTTSENVPKNLNY